MSKTNYKTKSSSTLELSFVQRFGLKTDLSFNLIWTYLRTVENDSLDPELLKRMMLGDFSASFANKKEHSKSAKSKKKIEVDLHFEKLHPDKPNLSAGEKLSIQLAAFTEAIEDARKQSIRNVYFIVGKGEGILKTEIQKLAKHQKIAHSVNYEPPYFGNAIKVNL